MTPNVTSIRNRHPDLVLLAGVALVIVIAAADYFSHHEMGFFVFYFAPIAVVAWWISGRAGLLFCLFAISLWFFEEVSEFRRVGAGQHYSSWFFQWWNTGIRFTAFVTVALLVTRVRRTLEAERALREDLSRAAATINELSRQLPACIWCDKVRDDQGRWQTLETFILTHTGAEITKGVCPACDARLKKKKVAEAVPG